MFVQAHPIEWRLRNNGKVMEVLLAVMKKIIWDYYWSERPQQSGNKERGCSLVVMNDFSDVMNQGFLGFENTPFTNSLVHTHKRGSYHYCVRITPSIQTGPISTLFMNQPRQRCKGGLVSSVTSRRILQEACEAQALMMPTKILVIMNFSLVPFSKLIEVLPMKLSILSAYIIGFLFYHRLECAYTQRTFANFSKII